MKIVYRMEGAEQAGRARDLSPLGAFIEPEAGADAPDEATLQPAGGDAVELLLDDEAGRLQLPGDVVRVTDAGFAIVFPPLAPERLDRLARLLDPDREPAPEQEAGPPEAAGPQAAAALDLEVAGEEWSPPVSEPVLHEWRPAEDFARPPADASAAGGWRSLPTRAPAPVPGAQTRVPSRPQSAQQPARVERPTAAPAAAAEAERAAEQKANELLGGRPAAGAQPAAERPAERPADGADQRRSERHERSIPVSFDNLTGLIKEFTHNISYGGMFVYSKTPMRQDSETAITLIHPVHGQRLTLLAKVVHTSQAPTSDPSSGEKRYGLGLEFRLPLDELKRMLSDFIGSHQRPNADPEAAQLMADARAVMTRGASSYYALLGLDEGAPAERVRQRYFKLVDRFHPDRYFGKVEEPDRRELEELFRRLTKAYETLTA